jgi:hypothetical protein
VIPLLPLILCAIHLVVLVIPLSPLIQCALHEMVPLRKDQVRSFLIKGLIMGWMTWIEFQTFCHLQIAKRNSASSSIQMWSQSYISFNFKFTFYCQNSQMLVEYATMKRFM